MPEPIRRAALMLIVVSIGAATIVWAQESPSHDATIVERAFLERNDRRHGEVRVVRDDACLSVQTLLYSAVLRRAVREIAAKELASEPDGSPFAAERALYLDALDRARTAAERRRLPGDDRRRMLLIEFSRCGERRAASVGGMRLGGPPDALEIVERLETAQLPVPAVWIEDRMRAVASDAFGLDDQAVARLLSE